MIRIVCLLLSLAAVSSAHADDFFLTLRVTKSKQLSGLLDYITPIFKAASNVSVHVAAVDPGQAAAIEEANDANALLLDDRPTEDKLIADHYGIALRNAMYDDFVIVGPKSDPAGIRGLHDAGKAFAQIAARGALFAHGDDSGANGTELRLWQSAGTQPDKAAAWYRDAGQDMAATLTVAAVTNAYTLTDRATWANFKDRQNLEILTEGDPALFNIYASILLSPVNPGSTEYEPREPREKYIYARIWHDWLTDKHGLAAITSYQINGEQIFFPCQGDAATICRSASQR